MQCKCCKIHLIILLNLMRFYPDTRFVLMNINSPYHAKCLMWRWWEETSFVSSSLKTVKMCFLCSYRNPNKSVFKHQHKCQDKWTLGQLYNLNVNSASHCTSIALNLLTYPNKWQIPLIFWLATWKRRQLAFFFYKMEREMHIGEEPWTCPKMVVASFAVSVKCL